MGGIRVQLALTAAASALALAPALAWAAGWLHGSPNWPIAAAAAAGCAITAAALGWAGRCVHGLCATAVQHLETLARLGGPDGPGCDDLPPLAPSHPLSRAASELREQFRAFRGRLNEVEHARAALEVRLRRAALEAEQIRTIFMQLAEPILVVDSFGELVLANHSAEKLFQLDGLAAGQRALDRVVRCEALVELLLGTLRRKTSGARSDEIQLTDAEGRAHLYHATACRIASAAQRDGEESQPQGALAVLRDIGEQKALQKRNAEFVSAVSHEMKTPLAGIKAYVELLSDGDAEDEQTSAEFLNVISGQADRLQRLVENMLNLARIEAGVVKVSKHPISLNELLEEAFRVVQPAAEPKRIALSTDLSPMYLGVLADHDMLLQAVINLLSNAIKYTPEGGRVTLRSRLSGNEVRVEVEDTGVGLSEEDCQRVFEKFYRVNKDKNMASGTGLGLPLARHIVEDVHSGRLTLRSVLGQGSTFTITLPLAGQLSA